jgi:two-component system, NarL family, response regulator LiaR
LPRQATRRTSNGVPDSTPGRVRPRPIRVLIADVDDLARNAIRTALANGRLSVVGQASDAPQAVSLASRCEPDVVLVDAALPPEGGLAAMHELSAVVPKARTILLSCSEEDDAGLVALAQGAAGYLSRGIELDSLAHAVEGVMAGEAAISRALAGRLIDHMRELSAGLAGMRPVRSPLTTREWEVLDLLKQGASTAQIAKDLVLSPDTVHSHVQNILRKLHAHSRAEAIAIAARSNGGSGPGLTPFRPTTAG